jgi:ABC-type sugar transport system ATPase subunit
MNNRVIALEVKNLSKHFGGIKAIDQIDMKLYKNEIIAIVGDNGAGKSTLIKAISGLHRRDRGDIFIDGKKVEINNPSDARKHGIETVYQSEGLISTFDAAGNLFLGRLKARNNLLGKIFKFTDDRYMRKEADKLLQRISIKLKDSRSELRNLSGGERQAVLVGRAVYWGGKIIIFDEPTNNLSVMQQKKVIELIKNIRGEYNVSIIVISHNINHVYELADRVIVLRNGIIVGERLKEETNPEEIISLITGVIKN